MLITQGYGKRFKIEVIQVGACPPYQYEVRKIEVEIFLTGDKVIKQSKTIKVVGIRDLYPLVLALQNEEPDTVDDILELVYIYTRLKAQIKLKKADQNTLELFEETKELLDKLLEKITPSEALPEECEIARVKSLRCPQYPSS